MTHVPVSVTEGLVLLIEAVQKCMNHSKSLTNQSFNQFLEVLYTFYRQCYQGEFVLICTRMSNIHKLYE